MFEAVLVANRGEIAVRIIRTLRDLGVRAVLAASEPNRAGLAARRADEVAPLEGHTAAETYLNIEAIIAAARAHGCEAIHPGYGFLSERPDFARACAEAGLVFIGPSPETLALLGDKVAARDLARANGVPVLPAAPLDPGSPDHGALGGDAAREVGYPLMVKARGGGGGRGMYLVRNPADLQTAIESARRQARTAFGDDRLFLERYIEGARHIEIQVLSDAHGAAVHLGERDCSIQRRHQKLVEETPSPALDPALRERLTDDALRLMSAAGYQNAGTVEFLVGAPEERGRPRPVYFIEANPRLQVEHPVTEAVTGLDLVALQLAIAAGEPLPFTQQEVRFEGHAIEFRLNAEDPEAGFLPSSGDITIDRAGFGRFDSGYETGDAVPVDYDSLIAKLIVHGSDRQDALRRAAKDLHATSIGGVSTNLALQRAIAANPDFVAGEVDIQWFEREAPVLLDPGRLPRAVLLAAARCLEEREGRGFEGGAWIAAGPRPRRLVELIDPRVPPSEGVVTVDGDVAFIDGQPVPLGLAAADRFSATLDRDVITVRRRHRDREYHLKIAPPRSAADTAADRTSAGAAGEVRAPLAGRVAAVPVREGDTVAAGATVAILDAMKMEHAITAPAAGRIRVLRVAPEDVVEAGALIAELEPLGAAERHIRDLAREAPRTPPDGPVL